MKVFNAQIGFTLIQIVIVIMIISVIAVIGSERLVTGTSLQLDSQTQQLMRDIRYAQSLAMASRDDTSTAAVAGSPYRIDLAAGNYTLRTGAGTAVAFPYSNSSTTTLSTGITMSWAGLGVGNFIYYDGIGIPYTASGTLLAGYASITVTNGSQSRLICVTPQTGMVSYDATPPCP